MATPRNKKHAQHQKEQPKRIKGLPRPQTPPGPKFWMDGVIMHEAMMMALVDESIKLIEPRIKL